MTTATMARRPWSIRRVSAHCRRVCGQVAVCVELRRRQWEDRSLRSRQRRNYLRLVRRCVLRELVGAALVRGALVRRCGVC